MAREIPNADDIKKLSTSKYEHWEETFLNACLDRLIPMIENNRKELANGERVLFMKPNIQYRGLGFTMSDLWSEVRLKLKQKLRGKGYTVSDVKLKDGEIAFEVWIDGA